MDLKYHQKQVDEWASQFYKPYWDISWQLSQLQEEAGELAREINHKYGPKKKKDSEAKNSIGKELADILLVLFCIANNENIDLQKEWDKMLETRLYKRDNQRFERKEFIST